MNTNILVTLLTAVLGGGLFSFVLGLVQARKQAPAIQAEVRKLSADTDASAVQTFKEALTVAHERIEGLEEALMIKDRQILDKDTRINELEGRILSLQRQIGGMQSTLQAMNVELDALRRISRTKDDEPGE